MSKNKRSVLDYKLQFVDFSHNDQKKYEQWIKKTVVEPIHAVPTLAEFGCKVSLSVDPNNGVYGLYITPKDDTKPTFGNVYVLRHSDYSKLCLIGLYYYSEILQAGEVTPDGTGDYDW